MKLRSTDLEVAIDRRPGRATGRRSSSWRPSRGNCWRTTSRLRVEERNQLAGQQAELKQKLASLEEQLALQKDKQLQFDVKSPIDGEVVTWDLNNRLPNGRPVQRGQVLLRVADPSRRLAVGSYTCPKTTWATSPSYQQTLYRRAREKLRGAAPGKARAKLGEAASQEDVDKAVDEELAKVHDDELRDKMAAIYLAAALRRPSSRS